MEAPCLGIRKSVTAILNCAYSVYHSQMKQDDAKSREEAAKREKETRTNMLAQLLTQEAIGRLNRIAVVKPEKAKMVENVIIDLARRGQIGSKMTENDLVNLIKTIQDSSQNPPQPKITIIRKRQIDSDEDY